MAYLTSHKDIWSLKKPRICRTQIYVTPAGKLFLILKWVCALQYLSADPDDIISPSGDQEHLIKF